MSRGKNKELPARAQSDICGSTRPGQAAGRDAMREWQERLRKNVYTRNVDLQHSVQYYFHEDAERIHLELTEFGEQVPTRLEPLVAENDLRLNHPRLEAYSGIGERLDAVVHHPAYVQAGNIIYGSRMMEKIARAGGMLESLVLFFLSSHAGEAGHNCPVACTAGALRVLRTVPDFPQKQFYQEKLTDPCFETNFTGAQFVTEIQGGSDVGLNDTLAFQDADGQWRVRGEKWFCSNADADVILMTARFDESVAGTKGLGLFLVPARLPDGRKNSYTLRRLKEKIGTRTMASGEIDFLDALAYPMGEVTDGFKMLMANVLHLSRIYNTFATLGAGRRAYQIARDYAACREAFGQPIIEYPLVQENLARIKAENTAMLASIMAATRLQDEYDRGSRSGDDTALLLRLLANLNKYLSAVMTVDHVHHAIDVLAGNGAIESFSALPRLLRDSIVFENWEGTHNTLRMQILRDMHKYHLDELFFQHVGELLPNANPGDEWLQPLQDKMAELKQQLQLLKSASPTLQSLRIKQVVDNMGLIYCGLHLLLEGMHQKADSGQTSKLRCLRYFYLLHFQKEPVPYDDDFLELIRDIVSG